MQSLLETLKKATDFLARKGLEKPRIEAEHLFAAGLGMKRLELYLKFEQILNDTEITLLREMTIRRGNREPLQHIVGKVEFRNLSLKCDSRALIPRPETEELIDNALALFPEDKMLRVLDLGTGSGAIALALAAERPHWVIEAIDRSSDALALAQENAAQCGLSDRIIFMESDWFENVKDFYDLIVSNPPYLSAQEVDSAEPEVRNFDPKSALIAGEEGFADLRHIFTESQRFLRSSGWILCETGITQFHALSELCVQLGYKQSEGLHDMSGRPRFWKAQSV